MQIKGLNRKFLVGAGFFFITVSCSREIEIKGFDAAAWQKDIRSCQNIRPAILPALQQAIPQLMGLNHTDIINVLGKPEGYSLEKSGERMYYYFTQPGGQCKNSAEPMGNRLMVRFDALDRVYKVRLENNI